MLLENKVLNSIIAFFLVFPVFFHYEGGLFDTEITHYYQSSGDIKKLPLPLSILFCYLSLFFVSFKHIRFPLIFVLSTMFLMMFSTFYVVSGEIYNIPFYKIKLYAQYVLPMAAILVGWQLSLSEGKHLERAVLFAVLLIIFSQLFFALTSPDKQLPSYIYFFSIYQHIQYVCAILVSIFIFALFSLYKEDVNEFFFLFMMPVVGLYAFLSASRSAILIFGAGLFIFAIKKIINSKNTKPFLLLSLSLIFLGLYYSFILKYDVSHVDKIFKPDSGFLTDKEYGRFYYWSYYFDQIKSDLKILFFGAAVSLDRSLFPSGHNYYLDFIYNFGVISLSPILSLIFYTVYLTIKNFRKVLSDNKLLGLIITVLFLLLIDNQFKVGMKQPYPGIVTFYLWGYCLALLKSNTLDYRKK